MEYYLEVYRHSGPLLEESVLQSFLSCETYIVISIEAMKNEIMKIWPTNMHLR
jgi:hypothetical protein